MNQSAKSLYIQALPTYDTKSLDFCEKHIRNHMLYARRHIPAAFIAPLSCDCNDHL